MKRTLQGSKSTKTPLPNMEDANQILKNADPAQLGEIQNLVDHYSGKSESELMNELLYARQTGAIDANALSGVAQTLAPMLSPEQQQRLYQVMRQLQ